MKRQDLCVFPTQVKLWYDKVGHQLIVNVLQAAELPLRPDGRPRSPYVKMYFLPDRRYKAPTQGVLEIKIGLAERQQTIAHFIKMQKIHFYS